MTSATVAVHRDPVWRERADFLIVAEIDPGETLKDTEQLWARRIDECHFEVCCVPFFTYHLALGDVVRTEPRAARQYVVAEVTEPSGRAVFRVWFGESTEPRVGVLSDLEALGGLLEWSSSSLLAIDVSDPVQARYVAEYLGARAAEGRLLFELGTAH